VILSHGLWTRRFAADPELVGRKITLDGGEWTVVGVIPPEFRPFDAERHSSRSASPTRPTSAARPHPASTWSVA
jgi:hypothetical protein